MKTETKISNYEKMKNSMAEMFLRYDQEIMARKFGLDQDENYLYICCLNRSYRISRKTGQVTWSDDEFLTERKADYNEAMTIYDVLCCSEDNCSLTGEWVNAGSLSAIQAGNLKKGPDFFKDAAEPFAGKAQALSRSCEALGGKKLEKGDVAYEFQLFPFLPVILRFWDLDEEFPASMQILVDKNILKYMHYETLMFAVSHLLNRLKDEM